MLYHIPSFRLVSTTSNVEAAGNVGQTIFQLTGKMIQSERSKSGSGLCTSWNEAVDSSSWLSCPLVIGEDMHIGRRRLCRKLDVGRWRALDSAGDSTAWAKLATMEKWWVPVRARCSDQSRVAREGV